MPIALSPLRVEEEVAESRRISVINQLGQEAIVELERARKLHQQLQQTNQRESSATTEWYTGAKTRAISSHLKERDETEQNEQQSNWEHRNYAVQNEKRKQPTKPERRSLRTGRRWASAVCPRSPHDLCLRSSKQKPAMIEMDVTAQEHQGDWQAHVLAFQYTTGRLLEQTATQRMGPTNQKASNQAKHTLFDKF